MSPDNNDVDDLDFSDLDLDDSGDSGFEEELDDGGAAKGARPAGKKSALFWPIAGVVIVAVAGLGLWQFGIIGGSSNREPYVAEGAPQPGETLIPGTEAAALAAQQQGAQPGTSDPFNVMGTPEGAPADSAMVEAMTPGGAAQALDPNAQPTTTDDMPVTSVMPAAEAQPSAVEGSTLPMPTQPGDTVPQAAPVETAGPATENAVPTAIAEAPVTPTVMDTAPEAAAVEAAAEAAAAPEATAPVNVTATDLNAIMERLEAIEKRLDAQAAAPEASPAVASELQDLKAAVARLENGAPAAAEEKPASKKAAKKSARKKTAKAKPKNSGWDKPYDGGAVGAVTTVTTVSTASPPSGGYSLRAAQPGVAWVSDSSGALQEVRVGDTLPGIGRVNDISQMNGSWTVAGQNGRLTQ